MEVFIKLNDNTNGRDKLARLVQYSAKLSWYTMLHSKNFNNKMVDTVKSVEYNMSNFRKLLRFGRFVDHLYKANAGFKDKKFTTIVATIAKVSYSKFLLFDHIIWISQIGIIDKDPAKWVTSAYRYWLITICLQLLLNVYELIHIFNSKIVTNSNVAVIIQHVICRKDLLFDTLKNLCDLIIPLSGLGIVGTNPGIVGAVGIVSSLVGIITHIYPKFRFDIS